MQCYVSESRADLDLAMGADRSRGAFEEARATLSCRVEWRLSSTSAHWRWYSSRASTKASSWVTCSTCQSKKQVVTMRDLNIQPPQWPRPQATSSFLLFNVKHWKLGEAWGCEATMLVTCRRHLHNNEVKLAQLADVYIPTPKKMWCYAALANTGHSN